MCFFHHTIECLARQPWVMQKHVKHIHKITKCLLKDGKVIQEQIRANTVPVNAHFIIPVLLYLVSLLLRLVCHFLLQSIQFHLQNSCRLFILPTACLLYHSEQLNYSFLPVVCYIVLFLNRKEYAIQTQYIYVQHILPKL